MICPICAHVAPHHAVVCPACGWTFGSSFSDALPVGTLLRGRQFRLEGQLGQGGFGITYLAHDQTLHRKVAIKELFLSDWKRSQQMVQQPGKLTTAEFQEIKSKFLTEARVLAGFNDPSIVRVYDQFTENNTAYLVMEYLQGETLAERLARETTVASAELVRMIQYILQALRLLHAKDLLHRDLKPDNIFLERSGRVVLIDFGSVRQFQAGKTTRMTQHLTPGYAPLEQYASEGKAGPPTDLYALGATLYHALSGKMPPTASELALGASLPPLKAIPDALQQVIVSAMKLRMEDRPQTVDEFLRNLTVPKPQAGSTAHAPKPHPPDPMPHSPGQKPILAYLEFMNLTLNELRDRLSNGTIQVKDLSAEVRRNLEAMHWLDDQGELTFYPHASPRSGSAKARSRASYPPSQKSPPPAPPKPPSVPPPSMPPAAFPDATDIHGLWNAVQRVSHPSVAPLSVPFLSPSKNVRRFEGSVSGVKRALIFGGIGIFCWVVAAPIPAVLCWLIASWILLSTLASTGKPQVPPQIAALDRRISELQSYYQHSAVGQTEFNALLHNLTRVKDQLLTPTALLSQRQKEVRERMLQSHIEAELRRHPIEPGSVTGIGIKRVKILNQHGIYAAFDVDRKRILRISGIGEKMVRDLLSWRSGLERAAQVTWQYLPDHQITVMVAKELWTLRDQLVAGPHALEAVLLAGVAQRERAQQELDMAIQQRERLISQG